MTNLLNDECQQAARGWFRLAGLTANMRGNAAGAYGLWLMTCSASMVPTHIASVTQFGWWRLVQARAHRQSVLELHTVQGSWPKIKLHALREHAGPVFQKQLQG